MNFSAPMATQLLLNQVQQGNHENFVVSPLSFNIILSMVAAGSTGSTLDQMLRFLDSKNIDDVNSKFSDMMMAVASSGISSKNSSDGSLLSLVNAIWVDKRFPLKSSYQEIVKGIYQAETKNVDFEKEVMLTLVFTVSIY
ncbi:unnamed protein product [Ilex paraguariensis]|uniref:Serpin domain-containing protein n=1 Tax=Ilex paraguariensis TaxID=185542 RepID=A0ABC8UA20_9AQUA